MARRNTPTAQPTGATASDQPLVKMTVALEPDLHKRLRIQAAQQGTTITAIVREMLLERLGAW